MQSFDISGFPASFAWHTEPVAWSRHDDGALRVQAGPKTDFFNDPATASQVATAPCAMMAATEPSFLLSAHVTMSARSTFDAGLIFVRTQPDHWAKFCLELSPAGQPTIVSVVTRGVSDDCNHAALRAPQVYLRVAKTPRTLAFHYSEDGHDWHLARYCSLGAPERLQIGWVAQSPMGEGCDVTFSAFSYRTGELAHLRDGQ